MPGMDGVAVLEEAKRIAPDVPFIIVTAHGTVETAVGAMKKGAYDFIIKPFKLDELEDLVDVPRRGAHAARPLEAARGAVPVRELRGALGGPARERRAVHAQE